MRTAAQAIWFRIARSHTSPWVVAPERRLPPLCRLPGQTPAQLANWDAEPKRLISTPNSATISVFRPGTALTSRGLATSGVSPPSSSTAKTGQEYTPVSPEHVSAFEVGYKYAGAALSFDASAFYYDYKDLQVSTYFATSALIDNAATSRIYGADAEAGWPQPSKFSVTTASIAIHPGSLSVHDIGGPTGSALGYTPLEGHS